VALPPLAADPRKVARQLPRFIEPKGIIAAMDEGPMRERVPAELHGGLWHTTHPDRFKRISGS